MGIGIGSSCIVLSSFSWGIFFFHEKVRSKIGACFAVACLISGLVGMSYYSSSSSLGESVGPSSTTNSTSNTSSRDDEDEDTGRRDASGSNSIRRNREMVQTASGRGLTPRTKRIRRISSTDSMGSAGSYKTGRAGDVELNVLSERDTQANPVTGTPVQVKKRAARKASMPRENSVKVVGFEEMDGEEMALLGISSASLQTQRLQSDNVIVLGREIPRRLWGMFLVAVFGLWGGSIMAPMKLSKSNVQGFRFVISFGIGAPIVNLALWLLRYFYNVYRYKSMSKAYSRLPSFHFDVMWKPGGLSGLLWSIGNFFSLTSVKYLGQGIGYPVVQSQLLVSGLWGIFLFKEVQKEQIPGWLLSALTLLFGILFLSYQHID